MSTQNYRKGVGAFLLNNEKKVFIAKRVNPPTGKNWQMPQGGLEKGETFEEAIMRELKEEIGTNNARIIAKTPLIRYDFPKEIINENEKLQNYIGQEQVWFALQFLGTNNDIKLDSFEEEIEFSEWRWENPLILPDLVIDFKRNLYINILNQMKNFKII